MTPNRMGDGSMNLVVLQGTLSSEPREQTLPSGSVVVNWEVTTRVDGVAKSVPVQWDDGSVRVRKFSSGDEVVVLGSIRRRFFRAGAATASRTDVVAEEVAKPTQKAALTRLLGRAESVLAA
ncbi:MAG: hypothetical protein ACR2P0_18860 [Acidimicrobiales bacterium]